VSKKYPGINHHTTEFSSCKSDVAQLKQPHWRPSQSARVARLAVSAPTQDREAEIDIFALDYIRRVAPRTRSHADEVTDGTEPN